MTTTSIIPSSSYSSAYTPGGVTGISSSIGTSGVAGVTSGLLALGISSSTSSHALPNYDGTISGIGGGNTGVIAPSISAGIGVNISPLPIRANQNSSSMPPICQVGYFSVNIQLGHIFFWLSFHFFFCFVILEYFFLYNLCKMATDCLVNYTSTQKKKKCISALNASNDNFFK